MQGIANTLYTQNAFFYKLHLSFLASYPAPSENARNLFAWWTRNPQWLQGNSLAMHAPGCYDLIASQVAMFGDHGHGII